MARTLVAGELIEADGPPLRVEPVRVDLRFKTRRGLTVHVLDHDGRRTGRSVPVTDGVVQLNGTQTQAVYYEVTAP